MKLFFVLITIFSIYFAQGQDKSKYELKRDSIKALKDSIKIENANDVYKDSIVFKDGRYLSGKAKELSQGVLKLKTPYSKTDFSIKWLKVKEFYSNRKFAISLNSGIQLFGQIEMDTADLTLAYIVQENGLKRPVIFEEIIYIKRIDRKFWDRLKANIDAGYTWTKANNNHQISLQAGVSYYGRKIFFKLGTNIVRSLQDNAASIKRTEVALGLQVYMPKDFFYFISNDLLSNTEQLLKLRSNLPTGFGYHYVNSNKMVGAIALGASWNNETFSNDSIQRNSFEGFAGLSYQIFNLGDLNVSTNLNFLPSLSELGRVRVDFKFTIRYKFPFDMYIGAGYTLNYDNRPTTDASKTDYVLQTSIGWSW